MKLISLIPKLNTQAFFSHFCSLQQVIDQSSKRVDQFIYSTLLFCVSFSLGIEEVIRVDQCWHYKGKIQLTT